MAHRFMLETSNCISIEIITLAKLLHLLLPLSSIPWTELCSAQFDFLSLQFKETLICLPLLSNKGIRLSINYSAHVKKLLCITLWMKFSTLVCRPHHLNLTVTSLYAHMWGQSVFSSFCEEEKKKTAHSSQTCQGTDSQHHDVQQSVPLCFLLLCQVPSIQGLEVLCLS